MRLSRCATHNKAECPQCGTYLAMGDCPDACEVHPVSSRACRYGTKSCEARHVCATCGAVNDSYCCEDSRGYDTPEYWEQVGLRLAKDAHKLDAPNGPECMCGRPSTHESGWCGGCEAHAETGHRCRTYPAESEKFPKRLTIEVYQGDRCVPYDEVVVKAVQEGKEPPKCPRGQLGCLQTHPAEDQEVWWAELSGVIEHEDGTKSLWQQLTDAKSQALAMYMAADLVAVLKDECISPSKPLDSAPNRKHCYCRDIVLAAPHIDGNDAILPAVQCCLCESKVPLEWWERKP